VKGFNIEMMLHSDFSWNIVIKVKFHLLGKKEIDEQATPKFILFLNAKS
jgi:hypothetical protein